MLSVFLGNDNGISPTFLKIRDLVIDLRFCGLISPICKNIKNSMAKR